VNAPILDNSPELSLNSSTRYIVSADCGLSDCDISGGSKTPHYWFTHGLKANPGPSDYNLRAENSATTLVHPFTVEDVQWMDMKVDDGQARSGKVVLSYQNWGSTPAWALASDSDLCIDNGVGDEYKSSETRRVCRARMELNF
jgi:hypothetical protein